MREVTPTGPGESLSGIDMSTKGGLADTLEEMEDYEEYDETQEGGSDDGAGETQEGGSDVSSSGSSSSSSSSSSTTTNVEYFGDGATVREGPSDPAGTINTENKKPSPLTKKKSGRRKKTIQSNTTKKMGKMHMSYNQEKTYEVEIVLNLFFQAKSVLYIPVWDSLQKMVIGNMLEACINRMAVQQSEVEGVVLNKGDGMERVLGDGTSTTKSTVLGRELYRKATSRC
jgi:hypothetical protein